jgi:hypothetical protein
LQLKFLDHIDKIHAGQALFPQSDILILIVPGYDYVENGHHTGADFAKLRRPVGARHPRQRHSHGLGLVINGASHPFYMSFHEFHVTVHHTIGEIFHDYSHVSKE